MVKIAFDIEEINVRGTTIALYDYARYNEEILNNQSIITMERSSLPKCDSIAVVHLLCRFDLIVYENIEHLEQILQQEKCDLLYCIKYGTDNGKVSKKVKTVVHCVFDMSEPHGDVYAGVSEAVAKKFNKKLFVPHMIGLSPSKTKENMRKELGIPESAIVFGRYGGLDTFNVNFCWQVIRDILNVRKDIYFLLINTPNVITHPHIKYLSKVTTEEEKNRFICSCDAHIECGTLGHSFGLAIGEFSVNNKPIIAYKVPNMWNTAHFEILGDKGIYFNDYVSFYNIINNWKKEDYEGKNWNCYERYMPEPVMKIFEHVFIK